MAQGAIASITTHASTHAGASATAHPGANAGASAYPRTHARTGSIERAESTPVAPTLR